jgi:hypothetical protein
MSILLSLVSRRRCSASQSCSFTEHFLQGTRRDSARDPGYLESLHSSLIFNRPRFLSWGQSGWWQVPRFRASTFQLEIKGTMWFIWATAVPVNRKKRNPAESRCWRRRRAVDVCFRLIADIRDLTIERPLSSESGRSRPSYCQNRFRFYENRNLFPEFHKPHDGFPELPGFG